MTANIQIESIPWVTVMTYRDSSNSPYIDELLNSFFPSEEEEDDEYYVANDFGGSYMSKYTTGTGQDLFVHGPYKCKGEFCVIHKPSNHHMREWKTHWRDDRGIMERLCEHGIGHPDPDEINDPTGIHGCDKCCAIKKDVAPKKQ